MLFFREKNQKNMHIAFYSIKSNDTQNPKLSKSDSFSSPQKSFTRSKKEVLNKVRDIQNFTLKINQILNKELFITFR